MKNASAAALSVEDPTRPTDWASPQPVIVLRSVPARYWLPRSERGHGPCCAACSGGAGHVERVGDEPGVDAFAHLVAEQPSAAQVEHHCQIQPALPGAHAG